APRLWKPLAVLFHDEHLLEDVGHLYDERSLCALLLLPLQLYDHGSIWKLLAVVGYAGFICADHLRIGDDYLEYLIGPGRRGDSPVLVSLEVGERDPAR